MSHSHSTVVALARWSASVQIDTIPRDVLSIATRAVIDTVGVTLAGSKSAIARQALAAAVSTAKAGHSAVIGSSECLCAPAAAFANATAGHALDFDDNCNAGFVHGSVVVWPAALAVAQMCDLDGARLLASFVVGAECEYVLAQVLTRSVYDKGWWTTGLLGSLGACTAACHALGLDAERTASAMGIALASSSALKAGFGTDAKPLMTGRASEAGVFAALLAAQGCSGPIDIVEHPRGLATMFGGQVRSLEGLGHDWRLLSPGVDIKRIPVCLSSHAAVDALREVLARHEILFTDIRQIVCDVPPLVIQNLIYDFPITPQQAQFSMPFALACTSVTGKLTLESLCDATIHHPEIQLLMNRIAMHTSSRWSEELRSAAPEGAWVKVVTHDGRSVEGFRARHDGSSSHPLSQTVLQDKFLECAHPTLPAGEAQMLLRRLEQLAHIPNCRALFGAASQAEGFTQ